MANETENSPPRAFSVERLGDLARHGRTDADWLREDYARTESLSYLVRRASERWMND